MTVQRMTNLICACGSPDFHERLGLVWTPGGGTVPTKRGYTCVACHMAVDVGRMIHASRIDQKRQEVQALEAEIAAQPPPPPPPSAPPVKRAKA